MIFATILAVIGGIVSLVLAISFQTAGIFFVGALITTVIAFLTNFLCKLILSPKVVTINRLTEIKEFFADATSK